MEKYMYLKKSSTRNKSYGDFWGYKCWNYSCHIMPLSDSFSSDRRVCAADSKGTFSVKSAYRLAMEPQDLASDPVSRNQCVPLWKKLWHAHIPASAKVCVWKAGANILPTADRLLSKQVPIVNPVCWLCNTTSETILHLCGFWKKFLAPFQILVFVILLLSFFLASFLDWILHCSNTLSKVSFHHLLFLIWCVWRERDKRVWEGKTMLVGDLIFQSNAWLHDFQFYRSKPTVSSTSRRSIHWKPPSLGWF